LTEEQLEDQIKSKLDMEKGSSRQLVYLIDKLESMHTILKGEQEFESALVKDDFEITFDQLRKEQKQIRAKIEERQELQMDGNLKAQEVLLKHKIDKEIAL
jgi:hypothetical protein